MTRAKLAHRARQLIRIAARVTADGPMPLTLARAAIHTHGAVQRTWELQALIADVRRLRPSVVVEIGTHRGGTLVCWTRVAADGAHLVSIDLPSPAEGMGMTDRDLARVRALLRPGQRLTAICADSHHPATLDELARALDGHSIDFLWVDGDHSDSGVRQDFIMYAPLVRAGGLIAFHDINASDDVPGNQVHHFWRELKGRYSTREYIDRAWPGGGMGIGVIEWAGEAATP